MLSILIPTYNYNIEALVTELHAQATACGIDFEILIGDDFSNQPLFKKSFLSTTKFTYLFRSDASIGRTAMRNLLSSKSSYPWLLFIDADMLPRDKNYIKTYLNCVSKNTDLKAYFGGYSYSKLYPHKSRLRHRYGVKREYKSALNRAKNPFRNIYSGNMLIELFTFQQLNTLLENRYGLDLAFSRQLETQNIFFKHLDNFTDHMGIEKNPVFILKSKKASKTLRYLYETKLISINQSKLISTYELLKKLNLIRIVRFKCWLLNPVLSWFLKNTKAPMFMLDIYKFYHFSRDLKE